MSASNVRDLRPVVDLANQPLPELSPVPHAAKGPASRSTDPGVSSRTVTFQDRWTTHVADAAYEEGLLYIDLGELADHLVALVKSGATSEMASVFDVVERLHAEGDPYVKEAATIGLLEGLQNRGAELERFERWLKPESVTWWTELIDFWAGKAPYVGAGLERKRT